MSEQAVRAVLESFDKLNGRQKQAVNPRQFRADVQEALEAPSDEMEVRVPIGTPGDLLRLCATPEGVWIRREPGYHDFFCEVTIRGPREGVELLADIYRASR